MKDEVHSKRAISTASANKNLNARIDKEGG
jgi:hypothetical protein